jgi:hypothetical protein
MVKVKLSPWFLTKHIIMKAYWGSPTYVYNTFWKT